MTTFCQPLPGSVAEEMLQVAARALCDRPGDSSAQRDSRTRQMVLSILGFEPRDGLEVMLATLAFGHFQLILDSMSDVFHGQADALKAKTKTAIVPLGRAMLEMIKELRLVRARPVAQSAEDVRREAAAATAPPVDVPVAPVAPVHETPHEASQPLAVVHVESGTTAISVPALHVTAPENAQPPASGVVEPGPEAGPLAARLAAAGMARSAPRAAGGRVEDTAISGPGSPVPAAMQPSAPGMGSRILPTWQGDTESVEDIAAYHKALAGVFDPASRSSVQNDVKAKAAGGD
jgi:hypothetical protein